MYIAIRLKKQQDCSCVGKKYRREMSTFFLLQFLNSAIRSHSYEENKNFTATCFFVMTARQQENKSCYPRRLFRVCMKLCAHIRGIPMLARQRGKYSKEFNGYETAQGCVVTKGYVVTKFRKTLM